MQILKTTALLASALALSACSSAISKKDCEQVDYYETGLKEARAGKEPSRIRELTEACTKEGVAVQADKYNYGRQVGLADYCDDSQAKADAKKGVLDSVCMKENVPPYQAAFRKAMADRRDNTAETLKKLEAERAELMKKEEALRTELLNIESQSATIPQ